MRRIALIASAALTAIACALLPAGAFAAHHHRHHHRVHHGRRASHHGRRGLDAAGGTGSAATGNLGTSGASGNVNINPGDGRRLGGMPGNAGTVVSFTEGVLTIKVGEGETATTVSGKVDEEMTEIHCIPVAPAAPTTSTPTTAHVSDDGGWGGDGGSSDRSAGGGSQSGSEDDQGRGDDNDDNQEPPGQQSCGVANLTPGTIVHQAELRLDASGAVFREIVLAV
jgi:hypothetical protein